MDKYYVGEWKDNESIGVIVRSPKYLMEMYRADEVAELAKRGLEANIMRRKGDQFGWDKFIAELEQIVKTMALKGHNGHEKLSGVDC